MSLQSGSSQAYRSEIGSGTQQSQEMQEEKQDMSTIAEVVKLKEGTEVKFLAKIRTQQTLSPDDGSFIIFQDPTGSIQGALSRTTLEQVKWAKCVNPESLVQVTGTLQERHEPIRSVSNTELEVAVHSIYMVNFAQGLLLDSYETPESPQEPLSTRVLDLRHPSNQALFRVRAMILRTFRQMLDDQGFVEIHTPRLQPAATEGGSETFEVSYYGRRAVLAQSQQPANQMAIAAGFERVYEIGPVFRANSSKPQQDLTEYTSLDVGMALTQSYTDLIRVIDDALKYVFATTQSMPELQVIRARWPGKGIEWLDKTPVIPFTEALPILRNDCFDIERGGLSTRDEVQLGQLVKEKYMTDYYILDELPANARPFDTHGAEGSSSRNFFNIFLRGHCICSGGQRKHDAQKLQKSTEHAQTTEDEEEEEEQYLTGFDLGTSVPLEASLCLESLVTILLGLPDVRYASLFHRDSKSLPERPSSPRH
ncbi:hypothetical protein S7711_09872 [Stachybotrys chartarum IBT 7711]|uniref:Aspartyl-tRNA synthetase n=1 Tax=Stachybotrys chartarum (strain CBS 109288 / IBT 7711) TaxID=1280523 RepID=A0A084AXL7_STACB|nr:hypothetical protein S7711_09872 [Stachybotrys chartarum IBT 7711]KFA72255.1 hypothetical protein S40288_10016 [Stachybotrys chartarum IBT 40288]